MNTKHAKWSHKNENCVKCHTITIPHSAYGMCRHCYRIYRKEHPALHQRSLAYSREWKEKNRAKVRAAGIAYYERKKLDPEWTSRRNEKNRARALARYHAMKGQPKYYNMRIKANLRRRNKRSIARIKSTRRFNYNPNRFKVLI